MGHLLPTDCAEICSVTFTNEASTSTTLCLCMSRKMMCITSFMSMLSSHVDDNSAIYLFTFIDCINVV